MAGSVFPSIPTLFMLVSSGLVKLGGEVGQQSHQFVCGSDPFMHSAEEGVEKHKISGDYQDGEDRQDDL